ncbi:unnamed protein product [Ceutorhynchus assimilis]|uniref:Beta-glucuronidase n=1 Tax=Ceutorhynchus assimilis TaxID=467358 RepID=A0A9N9QLF7_9CUCU|nr:unnamed protein product [Ceutorhynchus assimilis]
MRATSCITILLLLLALARGGILPVKPSETRDVINLDGLWYFTTDANFVENIEEADDLGQGLNLMPVPSSYNDIATSLILRDHVGSVWYKKYFFVPGSWSSKRVWIRFGSVCYNASVIINGASVVNHSVGHLPFATEISRHLNYDIENNVLVEVNNILDRYTIPQGYVDQVGGGKLHQFVKFDFFNYAGIDRPVYLYTTNDAYIDDINIDIKLNGTTGLVTYSTEIVNPKGLKQQINILDKNGHLVAVGSGKSGTLEVENAKLWWPYLMRPDPGYLYTFEVILKQNDTLIDHYKQRFGIRSLYYDNDTFTINNENIYIRGFGRHEDSDIRGKGLDLPLIIRDHHLIKWIGANCYRTSHYPYAEEIMDLADELGIMIIDEVPSVVTANFSKTLLSNHKQAWSEMYQRDKNRPSVIMWSIANEPRVTIPASGDYFKQVVQHVKTFDTSRPITLANMYSYDIEYSGKYLDIIGVNRYEAWYVNPGQIDGIVPRIKSLITGWRNLHNKPVLFTEYGADVEEGLSTLPSFIWTEEYGNDLITEYFKAFDQLRSQPWFVGEMIWNFADFKTDTDIRRVGGNKKGLFTRNRQPKAAAFVVRKRYWALAHQLYNATLPKDLELYISDSYNHNNNNYKDEL